MGDAVWLNSYPPGVPAGIDPDRFGSVPAMLLDACARHAHQPAFDSLGASITYGEWDRASRSCAAFLKAQLGRRRGDRVAIMLPNVLSFPVAFLGTLRAGFTVVNVNPLYTPRELEHQLNDAGATVIVIMENFAHKLEAVIARTPIEHVVVACLGDLMRPARRALLNFANTHVRRAVPPFRLARHHSMHDACTRTAPLISADWSPGPAEAAVLQYTGGTTGVPRAAVLSHRNLVANTLQCLAFIGAQLEPGAERILTPLPLYHIFSLTANLLTCACLGGLNVLIADPRDLHGLVGTMRRVKPTAISGVNTLFNALVNLQEFRKLDFGALKLALGGGAAIQSAVAQEWQAVTGATLIEGYGLTEASPVVCVNPPGRRAKPGTVGLPIPSTEVSIRDDDGRAVPTGEAGEIWVRGPQVSGVSTLAVSSDRRLVVDRRHWLDGPPRLRTDPRSQEGRGHRLRIQGISKRG